MPGLPLVEGYLHARGPVVPAAGALRTALIVLVLADLADAAGH